MCVCVCVCVCVCARARARGVSLRIMDEVSRCRNGALTYAVVENR